MSSPLYLATCLDLRASVVDIDLWPTPAIIPHFQLSDFFGFALVHESASARARRPGQPRNVFPRPLAGALASELTTDTMSELCCNDSPGRRATTAKYVVRAGFVSTRNWTPSLCTRAADGVYRQGVDPRAPGARAVQQHLAALSVAAADDDALVPTAVMRIEMTEPRWCAHLEPGISWDVYAFDDDAPLLM